MENGNDFAQKLISLVEQKSEWYDSEELPRLLENFS